MGTSSRRGTIEVFHSFKEADDAERRYWWSRTPVERLCALQRLRELNHGDLARAKIQKVFEFVRIPER